MIPLDDMIREARKMTGHSLDIQTSRIMSMHYGLHVGIARVVDKRHPKFLVSWCEVVSYMFHAFPILLVEWDAEKGKASTCWRKITLRLIRNEVTYSCMVGSVRVPERAIGRFKRESHESADAVNEIDKHEYLKRSYKRG